MSKKVKDIIFYCFAGVLAIAMGIAAVIEATKGDGNLAVSIIVAAAAIGLLVVSGIEVYSAIKTKNVTSVVESKPAVEEAKSAEVVEPVKPAEKKPAAKKAPAKKSTTKKSSK